MEQHLDTVLQGGALPPITTTQKTATSAPGFYMDYLNNLATQAQQGELVQLRQLDHNRYRLKLLTRLLKMQVIISLH